MNQQDAFDFERAIERRDAGIQAAGDHAEAVSPGWVDRACDALSEYLKADPEPFLMETFRAWVDERHCLMEPPNPKAWGQVAVQAQKRGLIEKAGYGIANSSNRSPKWKWKARTH